MTSVVLPELHLGRPRTLGPLTVFPIWTDAPSPVVLASLAGGAVEVTEIDPEPDVGTLCVSNQSANPVLLLEGELLAGGWQHRVVANDVIVGSGSALNVSVACVEAGRWQGDQMHSRSNLRASPSVRAALTGETVAPVQAEVWERVAAYQDQYGPSPTSSYLDLNSKATVEVPTCRTLPGQRGLVIGAGGYPILLELFHSTGALKEHVDALTSSVGFDAANLSNAGEAVPSRRARRMIERLEALPIEPFLSYEAGQGETFAARSEQLVMRGLQTKGRWAHLVVFDARHPLVRLAPATG